MKKSKSAQKPSKIGISNVLIFNTNYLSKFTQSPTKF